MNNSGRPGGRRAVSLPVAIIQSDSDQDQAPMVRMEAPACPARPGLAPVGDPWYLMGEDDAGAPTPGMDELDAP